MLWELFCITFSDNICRSFLRYICSELQQIARICRFIILCNIWPIFLIISLPETTWLFLILAHKWRCFTDDMWLTLFYRWYVIHESMLHLSCTSKVGQACGPLLKMVGLWDSLMELARAYDYIMGLVIFMPLTIFSWFPFVSEFQTRMFYNQAFSRGVQISMILAGKDKIKINWSFSHLANQLPTKI